MNIGKFSVTNSVLVNIAMVAILVMGVVSLMRLPREAMSDVSFSWVFIAVPYPGASAEQVEKSVTIKIEDEVSDVDRIKRIRSTTKQGVGLVQVEFEDDVSDEEFMRLYQDVRAEFDKVELPDGTLDPWVDDFSTSDFMPIIYVNLKGDVSDAVINDAARTLQDKLLDIDNVSKAEIVGGRDREVLVEVDRDKMEAHGVAIDEVINALKYRNMNIPGGYLTAGSRRYLLQVLGEIEHPEDFGEVIVRRRYGQGSVKVSDVASVGEGFGRSVYDVRFDGEKAVSLLVSKTRRGNTIDITRQVREAVDGFEKSMAPGLSVHFFNDTSVLIADIIEILTSNAAFGFVTLILVLMAFIGIRNSMITALGIPVTFAITFMFMEGYGETLNGNSLFALVMVLGMIVDHAIVIIENSYRHRQLGLSRAEAAITGTNEVIKPVISGTLTTMAAFLPMMLLPGIMGKFMRTIPMVVSIALAASTLEALLILPSHFAEWGSKTREMKKGFIGRWQDTFRGVVTDAYRHRYLTLVATLGSIVLATILAFFVEPDLYADEDFTMFYIDYRMPMGTPRDVTNEVAGRFEERLLPLVGNGEIVSVTTYVGFQSTDDEWITASHVGQLIVDVAERKEGRKRPISDIVDDVKELCAEIPGAEVVNYRKVNTGPPRDKDITFRVQGDNYDDLASIADDYVRMLGENADLTNIDHNFDRGAPELRIRINEERASELGLNVGLIGLYIRNSFEGAEATTYFLQDEEIDVVVKWSEDDRMHIEDITQLKFPARGVDGGGHRWIPFSAVCSLERGTGLAVIKRKDHKREITVGANTTNKSGMRDVVAGIQRAFDEKYATTYPGVSLEMGGEFAEFGKVISDVLRLLGVGLFLMYVILGAQFKSFFQPLLIGTAICFAAEGCILFLVATGTPFSIVVMFAGAALTGICVNDSIVLISFINALRRKGMETEKAVIEGACVRLRPIILTSVTTMAGLAPMAIGLGGYSPVWAPMARTIMFGLLFSTVGTLLVIPCLYGINADIAAAFGLKMKLEGE